ncbi:MAG TPA: hypothetical protein PLR20_09805 [Syntrophales bacterium]|nr:hypothetical protein [Syntrophales bacterium]HOX93172.1 hypothetical protein [Syntrophales bacterium]HPI57649.1 hypothetical protein [Syntrophales bacterium]HPN25338.1 hypothetical protein [Syntrophales bacterium]HQM29630.1 hypothetical protein [Syntrophales bacterium]
MQKRKRFIPAIDLPGFHPKARHGLRQDNLIDKGIIHQVENPLAQDGVEP